MQTCRHTTYLLPQQRPTQWKERWLPTQQLVVSFLQVQKQRSKDASKQVDLTASDALREQLRQTRATLFQGYEDVQGAGAVVAILRQGQMVSSACQGVKALSAVLYCLHH